MAKLLVCGVCGRPFVDEIGGNCPFCGAHASFIFESKSVKSKYRCDVCGGTFDKNEEKCPICGADSSHIKMNEPRIRDMFDLDLKESDIALAKKALLVEVSNSTFYFCAAEKSDQLSERYLFCALGEVEREHAVIWQKFLKLESLPVSDDRCEVSSLDNLLESHRREDAAINFYKEAAEKSINKKLKVTFKALVEIETDHLNMSEERAEFYKK